MDAGGASRRWVPRAAVATLLVGAGVFAVISFSVPRSTGSSETRPGLPSPPAVANTPPSESEGAILRAEERAAALPKAHVHGSDSQTPQWTALGPEPEAPGWGGVNSGRVTSIALSPTNANTLFIGAADGGVWESTNDGASWATHTGSQPNLAMGSVVVDPSNSLDVFAGTGEADSCADCANGDGILESTDGGATWSTSNPGGLFTGAVTSQVVVEPGASSLSDTTVLVANSQNLYVSSDGGATWHVEAGTGWQAGAVRSLVINPLTSPLTIYAWTVGVGVQRSTDNGATWSVIDSTAADDPNASGVLAVYPRATDATLYDSISGASRFDEIRKSTDGGTTWTTLPNCTASKDTSCVPYFTSVNYAYSNIDNDSGGDQGLFDNTVAIDPVNPNVVVAGGIVPIESLDGGTNWIDLYKKPLSLSIHPDFHALRFDPSGNLYLGNDGGIWKLPAKDVASGTPNYFNLNANLDITEMYTQMSVFGNADQILIGSQDNGSIEYSASSPRPTSWDDLLSGDGGGSAIDPVNPNIQIIQSGFDPPYGLFETTNHWKTMSSIPWPPAKDTNAYTPIEILPTLSGPSMLLGADGVYKTTNNAKTWSHPEGYTGSLVSALAIAPDDASVVYAGFNDGTIEMSTDAGSTWTTIDHAVDQFSDDEIIAKLVVSPTDPYTLYVAATVSRPGFDLSGQTEVLVATGLDTVSPTWTNDAGDLPTDVLTNAVLPDGHGGLIVANDVGVFWAPSPSGTTTSWEQLGTGLPAVQVTDLTLTPDDTLIASTHGRGAWSLPFGAVVGATTSVCVWRGTSGAGGDLWSVGTNWTTTSGPTCSGPGGPPTGAQIIFPAKPANAVVAWDTGEETGGGGQPAIVFNSLTFQAKGYHLLDQNTTTPLTLAPTIATTNCGPAHNIGVCASFPTGSLNVPFALVLAEPEAFAARTVHTTLVCSGTLTGLPNSLAVGAATDDGWIQITGSASGLVPVPPPTAVKFTGVSSTLSSSDRTALASLARSLVVGASVQIKVDAPKNAPLAKRRATAIDHYLIGLAPLRVKETVSTGGPVASAEVVTTAN